MDALSRLADPFDEPRFQGGVRVLVFETNRPFAVFEVTEQLLKTFHDGVAVFGTEQPLLLEHFRVCHATPDVIANEPTVKFVVFAGGVAEDAFVERQAFFPQAGHQISMSRKRSVIRTSFTLAFFVFEGAHVQLPDTVEIDVQDPAGSVIWLHGLGADGHDFEPIVPELGLGGLLNLRFVFPHAPMRPVTINGGMTMRAWYDIISLDRGGPVDEAGIRESGDQLLGLIERERDRGFPFERIVLAGFSQGGAIVVHTALMFPHELAGLMALSTYMPLQSAFGQEVIDNPSSQSRDLPIFMAHGSFDPMLPVALGESSRDLVSTAGYQVEWHDYPMAHAVCAEEIADIRSWLLSVYREQDPD